MVEFALVLPILLLVLLMAVDAGRLFFGWESLQNAARIGANYAANYPLAWGVNPNATQQAQYRAAIQADMTTMNCSLPATLPAPTFPDGIASADGAANLGGRAQVTLSCDFGLLTPFVGAIMGNPLHLTATAVFPIKGGIISTTLPSPSPSSSPSPSPSPSASASATPPMCTVPNFVGLIKANQAPPQWKQAGFVPTNLTVSLGSPNYTIGSETPSGSDGTSQPCATFTLTVGP